MAELTYKLTNDTLFKMLFVEYPDLLKRLVAVLLGIRFEDIEEFDITNPEMQPEVLGEKFCRLDINMTVNGRRVDLEIQVNDEHDYRERSLYYWAREFSSALPDGEKYHKLPPAIVISILAFPLFDCKEYYSHFEAREVTRHERLTDKFDMRYFELSKLPEMINADDKLVLWLSPFRAKTEEELLNIKKIGGPIMEQLVQAYYHVSATDRFKELERLRSRARHNEASALYNAECKARQEMAKNLKELGIGVDVIAKAANLTVDDILRL